MEICLRVRRSSRLALEAHSHIKNFLKHLECIYTFTHYTSNVHYKGLLCATPFSRCWHYKSKTIVNTMSTGGLDSKVRGRVDKKQINI